MEQRLRDLEARLRDYENRLISSGVEIKQPGYHDPAVLPMMEWNNNAQDPHSQMWAPQASAAGAAPTAVMGYGPHGHTPAPPTPRAQETNLFALPVFRTGCHGDNYLGVSSGNSYLSSIKGTALSVLGMEIDIADFSSSDIDEPASPLFQTELYNKSYQSFLQSALNINPRIEKLDLPPHDEGRTYANWYLRVLNPYIPVLHGPSFMALVSSTFT